MLFVFNGLLESANSIGGPNINKEDATVILIEDQTIELECSHGLSLKNRIK